jgi:hypothetical protein
MTRKKRKYTRLVTSKWAELRALWETGDHGLAELSDQYGVSPRTIQSHVSKLGSVKGAKAAAMAAVVQKEIFTKELGDEATLLHRAKEIRESTYTNAKIMMELIMAQLPNAKKNPAKAFTASTALRALALAASALERLHNTQLRALGLDKENALPDEMPVLTFRDLGSDKLEAFRKRDEADEESDLGISIAPANTDLALAGSGTDDSDDIITEGFEEGDETEAAAKASPTSLYPLGGRLVREHLP